MYSNVQFERQNYVWKRTDLGTSNHYSKPGKKKLLDLIFFAGIKKKVR
jgi:hypothetical protein